MQAPGLHIIQYCSIYKTVDHNDNNNINYQSYVHRGPCTRCGKMTHKENLD